MSENFSVRVGQRLIAGRKSDPARKPERGATPLIVALHGGGFTSGYFDAGPYSLLDAASAAGCAAVALDRPGYGSSSPLPEGDRAIPRNAEFLRDAVAEIWRQRADDLTGVVLVGHSIGSLTSLHIAADPGDWPLLGVAVSGLGLGAPPITPFWNDHGPEEWVETPTEYRLGLMFGQPGTYTADGPELSNTAARPVWWREIVESYTTWPDEAAGVASRVRVPVHLRQGAHDILWPQGQNEINRFAGILPNAPWVDAALVPTSGHCIDFHLTGATLHKEQVAFAIDCAARSVADAS
ncbi:alpha/beta hydrolase [Streptomyces chartreusis]|uniref:alpha/beta fold hydrolase n=1 Tax=Streptomyces chartreusis TaxID=1969 RepID=UPI002F90CCBE|nr:alpha/beta hydrolase [Streptomyces chartreusis]WTA33521.1 alpha/beta hydrolase [Streptomyces chartreusis]